MKKKICFLLLSLLIAVGCFSGLTVFGTPPEEDSSVQAIRNFNIKTDRNARYRDWECLKSQPDALEEYTYYSGADFASTGGLVNGVLYETDQEGASTQLCETVYGEFTMLSQPLQEVFSNKAPNWNKDYQEYSLIFTDKLDESNVITFRFTEQADCFAAMQIAYGGETYHADQPDNNANFSICGPLYFGTADCAPTYFSFSPADGTAYCNGIQGATGLELNELFENFHGFREYSAAVQFNKLVFKSYDSQDENGNWYFDYEGNGAYRTAKLMVYELCGQILAGEEWKNTAGPMITAEFPDTVAGQSCALSEYAKAIDLLDGVVTDIRFEVRDPEEREVVLSADGKLVVPTMLGKHTVKVIASDSGGKTTEARFEMNITTDLTDPRFVFPAEYAENYPVGREITLIIPTVTDNVDDDLTAEITVMFNEQSVAAPNGKLLPQSEGTYVVCYHALDKAGNECSRNFTFHAVTLKSPGEITLQASAEKQSVPLIQVPQGWSYRVELFRSDDTGFAEELLQNGFTYLFDRAGEYLLRYSVITGDSTVPSETVTVRLKVEGDAATTAPPENGSPLAGWQIACIAVGGALVLAGAALVVVLILRRRRKDD